MIRRYVLSSESVTRGHPDKLCDRISDGVLDHFLQQDPFANPVVECAVASSILFVAARFQSAARVDIPNVARGVIEETSYDPSVFDGRSCSVVTSLAELPLNEDYRIDERKLNDEQIGAIGARHQVNVFGFACDQTPTLMPLPITLAHLLARTLDDAAREHTLPYLSPDGKSQVSVEYEGRVPKRIHSITVVASQVRSERHGGASLGQLREEVRSAVIDRVFADQPIGPDERTQVFINPDGAFVGGGPASHAGLTGRKNGVDTYGEYSRHSGAALSGKGPMRIDRIGAYVARYAAKNIVGAGLAKECQIQLSYTIGLSSPVSVRVRTFGTETIDPERLEDLVQDAFDFRPAAIIRNFDLRFLPLRSTGGFYRRLACYGHLGRVDVELPWEALDRVEALTSTATST